MAGNTDSVNNSTKVEKKDKLPVITHGILIIKFKCQDETIQNIINKLYADNEDFIDGMRYVQFIDESTIKEIKKVIENAKK